MTGRLAGKIAIVTGGARGIGAETARLFAEQGAKVLVADLLETEGNLVAKGLGDAGSFVRHDVSDENSWTNVVSTCVERFGPPSILVNNAGVMILGALESASEADFTRCFRVNTLGTFLGLRAMLGVMRDNGGGAIVTMSSNAGVVGTFGMGAYATSKSAVLALTKTAAIEFGQYGIRVNVIAPGGIDTPMSNQPEFDGMDKTAWYGGLPIPRIGRPEEIARTQLFLASEESSYITGSVFLVDGGQLAGPKVP